MGNDDRKRWVEAVQAETRRSFDNAMERFSKENRRFFEIALEGTRHEIRLVAESVSSLDQTLTERLNAIDEKLDRTTAETQAMIRFSHADLDRRMDGLEQNQRHEP